MFDTEALTGNECGYFRLFLPQRKEATLIIQRDYVNPADSGGGRFWDGIWFWWGVGLAHHGPQTTNAKLIVHEVHNSERNFDTNVAPQKSAGIAHSGQVHIFFFEGGERAASSPTPPPKCQGNELVARIREDFTLS